MINLLVNNLDREGKKMIEVKRVKTRLQLEKEFNIRQEVFVKEQGVPPEVELDDFDTLHAPCKHILVEVDGEAVGTGRVRFVDEFGKLERICVLKQHRNLGLGKVIVKELEQIAREQGMKKVKLHSQSHAKEFYEKLGYEVQSDEFMEEGIPHYLMVKELL